MAGRYHGRRRRGVSSRGTRRRGNAATRTRRVAKHSTGAKAQSKQITSLAGSVVTLQRTLRDETQSTTRWQSRYVAHGLDADTGIGLANSKGIFTFPLTSGPAAVTNGASSSIDAVAGDMSWTRIQPKIGTDNTSPAAEKSGKPWIKLYRQSCKMCFYQNDMNRGNKFHLFVVRLARDNETNLDNTMLARLTTIDGAAFTGNPGIAGRFKKDEDFYACAGFRGPTPTDPGGVDTNGYELVSMNNQRYVVEYHRHFSLGRSLGPVPATATIGPSSGGSSTQHARDYYECDWIVNYGGAKLMAPDDDTGTNNDPITLDDIKYTDIDPKLKRWCVIFPQRQCSTSAGTGIPKFSLLTTTTCKVGT